MASKSSKTLPFISVAIIVAAMVASAMGYAVQIELIVAALPVLAGTALGGLYNKKLETELQRYREISQDPAVKALIEKMVKDAQVITIKHPQ